MCYDQMDVFIQNILEISASTLSEISKTLNAHNFLNSYQKILILHFKKIALIQRNPTKEEFLQFQPVLRTTQNDENLHVFDSDSLQFHLTNIILTTTQNDTERIRTC